MTAGYQARPKIALGHPNRIEAPTMTSPAPATPCCTLVGAGPGDPELLTLKALKAIESASVLLVDDLVSQAIVALAPAQARVIHVGKRGGCPSTPQAFIEKLMIAQARKGERVVRLKGGDPFIFGRGGEEVERLRRAGIAVQVISGITAGLAGVSSLGLPLTHREHAQGVVFLTGHAKVGGSTDWAAMATMAHRARLTLVIYMGMSQAAALAKALMEGLPPNTPAAVIQDVSLPRQRHIATTLARLASDIARHKMRSPAVIVVGDVMAALAWAERSAPMPDLAAAAG
jgi:uroporphyrin-III C-methyltransferase